MVKGIIVLSLAALLVTQVAASEFLQLPSIRTSTQQNILEFENVPVCQNYSKEQEVASSYTKTPYISAITLEENQTSGDVKTTRDTDSVWDGAKNQVSVCRDKVSGTIKVKLLTIKQEVLQIEKMEIK